MAETLSRMFADLSDHERERVRHVLRTCPAVELPAGRAASAAELPDATLLMIDSGVVLLENGESGASRRIVAAVAGPGDVLAPPTGGKELRALTCAQLTAVVPNAQRALLFEPGAAAAITAALVEALRDREDSLANVTRFPHAERVRRKLLQLARRHGKVGHEGVLIDLPLTHELISELVGSTRETVTLALRELGESSVVSRVGHRYRLNVSPGEINGESAPKPR